MWEMGMTSDDHDLVKKKKKRLRQVWGLKVQGKARGSD